MAPSGHRSALRPCRGPVAEPHRLRRDEPDLEAVSLRAREVGQ